MKETTIDYVLGRCLILKGQRWRVLEIDPQTGRVRVLRMDGPLDREYQPKVRALFHWPSVVKAITEGEIEVD